MLIICGYWPARRGTLPRSRGSSVGWEVVNIVSAGSPHTRDTRSMGSVLIMPYFVYVRARHVYREVGSAKGGVAMVFYSAFVLAGVLE